MLQRVVRQLLGACTLQPKAKVADLELAVDANEEVLGLDVPVDDVLREEVGEGISHLVDTDGTAAL